MQFPYFKRSFSGTIYFNDSPNDKQIQDDDNKVEDMCH